MSTLDLATMILSAAGAGSMLCRLDALRYSTHRVEVIALHMLLAWVCIVSGVHAYEGLTDLQDVLCPLATLCWVAVSLPTWRHGPPRNAASRPIPLDDEDLEQYRGGWQ